MDPSQMTEKSREALQQAHTLATRHHHQQVDNEHLLLALLEQENGADARILQRAGGDLAAIRTRATQALARLPQVSGSGRTPGQVYIRPRQDDTLAAAVTEVQHLKDEYVSVEHLLLALADEARGSAP